MLIALVERFKAGSPTQEGVYWISLKPYTIAKVFEQEHNIKISNTTVKHLLKELGYGYRKQSKQLATGSYANRNDQFKIICTFNGYFSIGASSETADFIIDNLLWWWEYGIHQNPDAKNILLLCDAGGTNSYRHHIFKHRLMEFARKTGLSIIVCHYPPYCSKWNPIEHRLFSQVHRAMEGVALTNYNIVKNIIEQTLTKTGLTVVVRLNLKDYRTRVKVEKFEIDQNRISFHPGIPNLNYRIYP